MGLDDLFENLGNNRHRHSDRGYYDNRDDRHQNDETGREYGHREKLRAFKPILEKIIRNKPLLVCIVLSFVVVVIAGVAFLIFIITTGLHFFPELARYFHLQGINDLVSLIIKKLLGGGGD